MILFYPKKDGTMDRAEWKDIRNYESYKIPILYLSGSIAGMTKDNKVTLNYIWGDRVGSCTAKWQGSSAVTLPGRYKNLTITFDNAFEVVSGWGAQKKYVLKANWVDPSHARNVVSAKLWGQMVKSRATANAKLNALPNGGAIDGFPVIVALNGKFHGLYTWNIPKGGWLFGMTESGQQFIVGAEYNNNGATAFHGLATFETDSNGEVDFEVEFSSDEKTDWVLTSINRLLAAVKDSDGTNIQYGITPYLDWDSAIDYYILSVLISNYDGQYRNYLLYSHDGVKIGISAYDMDVVYGNRATGKYFHPADSSEPTFASFAQGHKLFGLIWTYMRPRLRERFNELVGGILSETSVANEFTNFVLGIPLPVYVDNERLWNQIPSGAANNVGQILSFYRMRLECAKEWIKDTSGEKALPEQIAPDVPGGPGYTNQMPISIGTDKNVYNGTGWKGGIRLSSSSGVERDVENAGATGFIPVKSNDVIRFKDGGTNQHLMWNESDSDRGSCAIVYYDASFAWLGALTIQPAYYGICGTNATPSCPVPSGTTDAGGIVSCTVPTNANIAYARICMSTNPSDGSAMADIIVTVNEEITD